MLEVEKLEVESRFLLGVPGLRLDRTLVPPPLSVCGHNLLNAGTVNWDSCKGLKMYIKCISMKIPALSSEPPDCGKHRVLGISDYTFFVVN